MIITQPEFIGVEPGTGRFRSVKGGTRQKGFAKEVSRDGGGLLGHGAVVEPLEDLLDVLFCGGVWTVVLAVGLGS